VKKGREIIITTHGEPVASLKPVERTDAVVRETAWKEFLEELRNRRAMNCEPWTRDDLYDDEAR
jgi:antitoxin (DNA-binding transcriptional repressor) of toxin-antitoxin stability system